MSCGWTQNCLEIAVVLGVSLALTRLQARTPCCDDDGDAADDDGDGDDVCAHDAWCRLMPPELPLQKPLLAQGQEQEPKALALERHRYRWPQQ